MGKAFLNDPLWKYLVPDEARRALVVLLSMNILVRYSLLYGEVYMTLSLDGVACWLPPGETTPTFSRLVRIGIHSAPFQLGWMGFRRYIAVENYGGEVHKHIVPGIHWYLWGFGVKPSRQGQGIGGMLMEIRFQPFFHSINCSTKHMLLYGICRLTAFRFPTQASNCRR